MLIFIDPEKCTNCRTCESVCSIKHFGECNPTRSRIRPIKWEKQGEYFSSIPIVCQQCETPLCKKLCPVNAIYQDIKTGAYCVNEDLCVGCRLCVIACPFGAIFIDPETDIAIKCDLCGGDPLCVKFCIDEALIYVRKDKMGLAKARESADRFLEFLIRPHEL